MHCSEANKVRLATFRLETEVEHGWKAARRILIVEEHPIRGWIYQEVQWKLVFFFLWKSTINGISKLVT